MSYIKAYRVEHDSNAKIIKKGKSSLEILVGEHGIDISFENDTHADYYIRSRPEKDRPTLKLHSWGMDERWYENLQLKRRNQKIPAGPYAAMNTLPTPSSADGKDVPKEAREKALHFSKEWKEMLNRGISEECPLTTVSYYEHVGESDPDELVYVCKEDNEYDIEKMKRRQVGPGYRIIDKETAREYGYEE